MKIIGLDGKTHTLNLPTKSKPKMKVSQLHAQARTLLRDTFPLDLIYEEVTLPGTKTQRSNKPLHADFFIPRQQLLIEVQGEQHYKFIYYFHTHKNEYYKAKARDADKRYWCELNNIRLVELPYNESREQWVERIQG